MNQTLSTVEFLSIIKIELSLIIAYHLYFPIEDKKNLYLTFSFLNLIVVFDINSLHAFQKMWDTWRNIKNKTKISHNLTTQWQLANNNICCIFTDSF